MIEAKNSDEIENRLPFLFLYKCILRKLKNTKNELKERGASLITIASPKGNKKSLIVYVYEFCFFNKIVMKSNGKNLKRNK